MLAIEHSARGAADMSHDRQEPARIVTTTAFFAEARRRGGAEARGHKWTEGQQSATVGLLTGQDQVTGVQGYAGTAKTTTVLATYAEGMRSAGYEVRAFAPTAAAASVLGDAIGARGETVAKAVLTGEQLVTEASRGSEGWIVDEAFDGQTAQRTHADRSSGFSRPRVGVRPAQQQELVGAHSHDFVGRTPNAADSAWKM
ncbi:hypothetical protein SPHINGOT1_270110 [Sphingomonas sp. T1]|uniref:AAA family ATPase n=1 Tax=Sphingomonas sp. T1 TaxID=2653172 RepID=UPI0012F3E42E|nr:AAA family ATPase [Sphingomonas sp. T1]VXC98246.1 hypothetical protein SPHINGOT1_270110 [Sphingomonas sp. T1]